MVGLGAAFGAVSGAASFAFAGLSTGAALAAETLLGAGLGSLDGFVTNGVLSEMHDGDFMDGAGEAAGWGALGGGIGGGAGGLLGRGVALGNKRLLNGLNRTHGIRGYIHVRAVGKNNLGFGHSMIGFRRGMYQRGYHQQLVGPVKVNSSKLIRGGRRLLLTKYLRLITRVPQLLPCNCHYSLHKTLRTWPLGG